MDEALLNRIGELVRKEDALRECVNAMTWFCQRVERGEIKSVKTYKCYKDLLNKFEKDFGVI